MASKDSFTFEISLSVLNHLGRHLYRSFATVLGEAISNAWDADARNVWLYIDRPNDSFVIKDDGIGMSSKDFQKQVFENRLLKTEGRVTKSKRAGHLLGGRVLANSRCFRLRKRSQLSPKLPGLSMSAA